jgi:hypothetical protein
MLVAAHSGSQQRTVAEARLAEGSRMNRLDLRYIRMLVVLQVQAGNMIRQESPTVVEEQCYCMAVADSVPHPAQGTLLVVVVSDSGSAAVAETSPGSSAVAGLPLQIHMASVVEVEADHAVEEDSHIVPLKYHQCSLPG